MKIRISTLLSSHFVVVLLLLLVPTTMCGQKKILDKVFSKFDSKDYVWLDKQSVDRLGDVEKWEAVEAAYGDSTAVRDSLKKAVDENKKAQSELNRQLNVLHSNVKAFWSNEKVSQYDEGVLHLHQNLCNDSVLEIREQAMFAFVRAGECLNMKYDSAVVAGNRDSLKLYVSEYYPSEFKKMDSVLEKYGSITADLRQTLISANDIRPKSDAERSQHMTEKYKQEFFAKLNSSAIPEILTSGMYPYLYGILNKSMEAKMNDPCTDITELIEKL